MKLSIALREPSDGVREDKPLRCQSPTMPFRVTPSRLHKGLIYKVHSSKFNQNQRGNGRKSAGLIFHRDSYQLRIFHSWGRSL